MTPKQRKRIKRRNGQHVAGPMRKWKQELRFNNPSRELSPPLRAEIVQKPVLRPSPKHAPAAVSVERLPASLMKPIKRPRKPREKKNVLEAQAAAE